MSDLRTRIAKVLFDHAADEYSWGVDGCTCGADTGDKQSQHQADAVIAELGMREQTGNNAAYPQVIPCADYLRTHHRYVTNWKADNETD